eukprot:360098-Chlamydomonas_euryale.AAC.3
MAEPSRSTQAAWSGVPAVGGPVGAMPDPVYAVCMRGLSSRLTFVKPSQVILAQNMLDSACCLGLSCLDLRPRRILCSDHPASVPH